MKRNKQSLRVRFRDWLLKGINLGYVISNNNVDNGSSITQCSVNLTTSGDIILKDIEVPEGMEVVIRKKQDA